MIVATPTNRRKRRLIDRYLLSPHHFLFNPFKKFKIPPSTAVHNLPPAAPLPRRVYGPDRILKVFGLWPTSSSTRPPPGGDSRKAAMGNLLSSFPSKKASRRGDRRAGHRRNEGRGLEDVKRLAGEPSAKVRFRQLFTPPVSDLRIFTQKDKEPSDYYYIVNRKVEDARRLVLEYMPSAGKKAETKVKKPKEDLSELFSPLTDEEKNIVNDAMHGGNSHEVLVIHVASNIEITREALRCLSDGGWLNDEVINVYLELLKEREKREPKRFLKCHFFSTFFYKKLTSGRNGYDFKAVRRWTSQKKLGYGLVECDKIFVPIHKIRHWCLAVINIKEESFQYLDSLGGMDTTVLNVLAAYFMDEVMDKNGIEIETTSWKKGTVSGLPLQKNGWDCGMFMLKYADFSSRGLSLCFSQLDSATCNVFNRCKCMEFRKEMHVITHCAPHHGVTFPYPGRFMG